MTKKIIMTLALTTIALTACGQKNAYRAARVARQQTKPSPSLNNEQAELKVEKTAEQSIQLDQGHQTHKNSPTSQEMKKDLSGVTAQVTVGSGKANVAVRVLDSQSSNCEEKIYKQEKIPANKLRSFVNIDGLGRFRCVDSACNHAILLIEKQTKAAGSVAILLKKDASEIALKPVNTKSKAFLQINNVDVAQEACTALMGQQQNGDVGGGEEDLNIEVEPAGDVLIVQQEKEKQDNRLKEIDTRLKEIESQIQALNANSSSQMPDEGAAQDVQTLNDKKQQLEKERSQILELRTQKAVEQEDRASNASKQPKEQIPVAP
ncbi:MAG: hypothetical protein H6623_04985 [Bdellovibrionaceae bacterium]|nr:hypothetical protein [Pseudobdellovibrionaceae bacterium]